MSLTWNDANQIAEAIYDIRALVRVMGDAACNETCPPNPNDLSAVLLIIDKRIDTIESRISDIYSATRNASPKWDADGEVGIPVEDSAGEEDSGWLDEEDEEDGEDEDAGRFTRSDFLTGKSLHVELKEEHPDGSATYTISSDDNTLQRLFEAFFTQALLLGIQSVEKENKKFTRVKRAAEELERFLRVWEDCADLDYDPEVKDRRKALTEALNGEA